VSRTNESRLVTVNGTTAVKEIVCDGVRIQHKHSLAKRLDIHDGTYPCSVSALRGLPGDKIKFAILLSPFLEYLPSLVLRKLKEISENRNAFWSRREEFVPLPSQEASSADEEKAREDNESKRAGM
jgi:hypothetical protein